MRILPLRRRTVIRRALLAASVAAAMAVPAVSLQSANAGPSPRATAAAPSLAPSPGRLAGTHALTLITGDVVALHVTADGRQSAWIADPVRRDPEPRIYEQDGQVHVVPAEAQPYVASGVLDKDLFNVTLLARSGYDDRATDELPLLVEASDTRSAVVPDVPDGTDEVRTLDSVDTVSVTAAKDDLRTTWEDLRGPRRAPVDSTSARLADGVTVWLNERVRATLDGSVAQIGAPQAWARGYDGDGATVAVLDTGYDPDHPDLAGRVVDARNFSSTPDSDGAVAIDGTGHGTHVAATVGGSGAASGGDRKGVAPGADLIIGKVLDDNGAGYTDQIIAGMEWAVENDADVVNMSLGTVDPSDGTDPLSEAVNDLTRSSGTLFVVAAGNTGSAEQTVGSPGAADLALTVGAVDKDDEPAAFSSRGPRLGDGAIKPEITAPGVDIVAARAAGTALGNSLDKHYTSLGGTSMATPHVAGAAAILAQQHPDWTPAQLKARLVSTAKKLPGEPVTFQGGGRLDVAAATRNPVAVNAGTLFLGRRAETSGPLSRKLTYRNASDRRVSIRLSADVKRDTDGRSAALRLSDSFVTIAAHGSTTVTATLSPRQTRVGRYAGQIVARPVGRHSTGAVHTTVAFTVKGPIRTVTVRAVDRSGHPASGPVDVWSADTGELLHGSFSQGIARFEVPEGLYTMVASIEAGELSAPTEHTLVGDPELRVERNVTLRFDARDARPIRVSTPRNSDVNRFDLLWKRTVGDHSVTLSVAQGNFGEGVYALQSPPARTGTFTFASAWQLTQPLLEAELAGPKGYQLRTPQLTSMAAGGWCRCPGQMFEGPGTLRLVDAGTGTPEEFAEVDAAEAVALVSRPDGGDDLTAQAEAAEQAGAAVMLAYNRTDAVWFAEVLNAPLPIYTIDGATGQALLDALAANSRSKLRLAGIVDATYQYNLAFSEKRGLPTGASYRARPSQLATMTSDYRQNSDRMVRSESWIAYIEDIDVATSMSQLRNGPVVRTEYATATDGVEWQRFAQPHEFATYYWTSGSPEAYRAGRNYYQTWWGPLVHPAVPTAGDSAGAPVLGGGYEPTSRYRDAIRMNLPHYSFGGSLASTIYEQFSDQSEVTLEREGDVVGTSTWPRAQWTVPPGEATYELSLDVVNGASNWTDTSVRTSTTWRFDSARVDIKGEVLPLVQVGYGLDTDAYNAVPADTAYPLVIEPGYQPGAEGPGRFTAEVEVSFDDGATWQEVAVHKVGGRFRAQIPAAEPGFASVRIVVTDAGGNRLTQQIDRAWKIAVP